MFARSTSGEMSHLSAEPRWGEKKAMVLSPVGAMTATSVGIMAGTVFHGLKTIGPSGMGLVAVPDPGNDTMLDKLPKEIG